MTDILHQPAEGQVAEHKPTKMVGEGMSECMPSVPSSSRTSNDKQPLLSPMVGGESDGENAKISSTAILEIETALTESRGLDQSSTAAISEMDVSSWTTNNGFAWKVGPEDFTPCCVIGQGAFGRVLQVRSKFDNEVYAMKVISKRMLKKKNHLSYMRAERDIMTKIDFPFIVGLRFSFQTDEKLFLVMDYLSGGELFFHLRKQGLILEDTARFYVAEMILALEHLHSNGIIHRDLKPENVLLGKDGHLCLTDFGLAKELTSTEEDEDGRARTVCGTNEYMAPEMITKKGYGKGVDWWSLGTLMYEMMAGVAPFRAKTVKDLNRKILNEKVSLPKWLSSDAHSVLKGLLERNVQKRLGAARSTMFEVGGVSALKSHRFFNKLDWQLLVRKQVPAPVIPVLKNESDTSNFDEEFTKMDLSLSLVEIEGSEATHSDTFCGFSFIDSSVEIPLKEPSYRALPKQSAKAIKVPKQEAPARSSRAATPSPFVPPSACPLSTPLSEALSGPSSPSSSPAIIAIAPVKQEYITASHSVTKGEAPPLIGDTSLIESSSLVPAILLKTSSCSSSSMADEKPKTQSLAPHPSVLLDYATLGGLNNNATTEQARPDAPNPPIKEDLATVPSAAAVTTTPTEKKKTPSMSWSSVVKKVSSSSTATEEGEEPVLRVQQPQQDEKREEVWKPVTMAPPSSSASFCPVSASAAKHVGTAASSFSSSPKAAKEGDSAVDKRTEGAAEEDEFVLVTPKGKGNKKGRGGSRSSSLGGGAASPSPSLNKFGANAAANRLNAGASVFVPRRS